MSQRLEGLKREDLKEFEPIWQTIEKTMGGFVPNSIFIMSHNIELMNGFGMLSAGVFRGADESRPNPLSAMFASLKNALKRLGKPKPEPISRELRSLIFMAVSMSAGCRYCQAHSALIASNHGASSDKIDDLLNYEESPHFDDAERAAIAIAFAAGEVPNAARADHFTALKAHYSTEQIVDIVAAIAYMGFLNRWNDTFATALEDAPLDFASRNLEKVTWEAGKHVA